MVPIIFLFYSLMVVSPFILIPAILILNHRQQNQSQAHLEILY